MKVEICCGSIESCVAAQRGGADRVELCAALSEGGVTPSFAVVEYACKILSIDVNVIIRPRGGDFVYSQEELTIMERDIAMFKQLGIKGVVFGCLNRDAEVDVEAMQRLIGASSGLSVTFHRAFDVCTLPLKALEDVIALGCDRILTSGQQSSALKGIELLAELNRVANGRIIIMPGCGVNVSNIREIVLRSGVSEIHFSASVVKTDSVVKSANGVDFGPVPTVSDFRLVEEMVKLVR